MKYRLDLKIDDADVALFRNIGQNIQIAKLVGDASQPSVVWLSIDPWSAVSVEWEETYGLYASNTQIQAGALIHQLNSISADKTEDQISYALGKDTLWTKDPSAASVSPGTYRIENNMIDDPRYPYLTFGLTQSATLNESTKVADQILNATPVPPSNSATFTPLTTVYLWMQGQQQCGSVIVGVTSKTTVITMAGGDSLQLHYDHSLGRFETVKGPKSTLLLPKGFIYLGKK
jgi:hypothetical protein